MRSRLVLADLAGHGWEHDRMAGLLRGLRARGYRVRLFNAGPWRAPAHDRADRQIDGAGLDLGARTHAPGTLAAALAAVPRRVRTLLVLTDGHDARCAERAAGQAAAVRAALDALARRHVGVTFAAFHPGWPGWSPLAGRMRTVEQVLYWLCGKRALVCGLLEHADARAASAGSCGGAASG